MNYDLFKSEEDLCEALEEKAKGGSPFFVIRHPQTEWNLAKILQGQLDSPLADLGRETAHSLANRLKGQGITRIIASDLGRCIQTTEIVNGILNLPVEISGKLREQDFGVWSGKKREDVMHVINLDDPDYVREGGESAHQMKRRVMEYIYSQVEASPNQVILFVAHDGALHSLLSEVYDCPLSDPRCKTTQGSIYEFELSGDTYTLSRVF